jgi:hypothetical protein
MWSGEWSRRIASDGSQRATSPKHLNKLIFGLYAKLEPVNEFHRGRLRSGIRNLDMLLTAPLCECAMQHIDIFGIDSFGLKFEFVWHAHALRRGESTTISQTTIAPLGTPAVHITTTKRPKQMK